MNRKASLSLSVNAIVVLVLAITMLGLGLGFTKGMFSKFSSKLTVPEPDIPATADDQIVLPSEEITIQKNKDVIVTVNVYNDDWGDKVGGALYCPTFDSNSGSYNYDSFNLVAQAIPQTIPSGDYKSFKMNINRQTQSGTLVCTLYFGHSASSNFAENTEPTPDQDNLLISEQVTFIVK